MASGNDGGDGSSGGVSGEPPQRSGSEPAPAQKLAVDGGAPGAAGAPGRPWWLGSAVVVAVTVVGLGAIFLAMRGRPRPGRLPAPDPVGLVECDSYLAKERECLLDDPVTHNSAQHSIDLARDAWRQAAEAGGGSRAAIQAACATGLSTWPATGCP